MAPYRNGGLDVEMSDHGLLNRVITSVRNTQMLGLALAVGNVVIVLLLHCSHLRFGLRLTSLSYMPLQRCKAFLEGFQVVT